MTNVLVFCVFADGAVTEPAAAVGKSQMHDRVHSPAKGVDRQSDSKLDNILLRPSKTWERTPACFQEKLPNPELIAQRRSAEPLGFSLIHFYCCSRREPMLEIKAYATCLTSVR